jgi:acetyl esterase/lipase
VYKEAGGVRLSLYVFDPPDNKFSGRCPAIVFFHGGGWTGGEPSQFYRQADYLASRGMVAISVEYRLKKMHGAEPATCVKDAKSAMRWIRAHADELGIDPHRLAAGGGSAGGHLAAATATLNGFNEDTDDLSVDCRPDALVLFNPVFDNGPDGGYGYDRVQAYWREFSPAHNLTHEAPPTVIFLGTKDHLIPVSTVEAYKKRMEELGSRCDLHLYEGQTHGFFNKSDSAFHETLLETDRFFISLGYLNGDPALQRSMMPPLGPRGE